MNLSAAIEALQRFSGADLTATLSQIESALEGETCVGCDRVLEQHQARHEALEAAGLMKQLVGQINVVIHTLGILLCLPHLLEPDERIESVSLGAGNTGKPFDLTTDRRLAEFKFITWRGGPEAIRQNSLFKDFYYLAEAESRKAKCLYVLGSEVPLKFLNGGRSLKSVLSKNVKLSTEIRANYPECHVVRDYYLPRKDHVIIQDISALVPGLVGSLEAQSDEL